MASGSELAGYRIDGVAGQGGMGVVYRATQLALDRPVALKVIASELANNADFRERFKSEAQLAASIDHPNVVPVYEAGEADGVLYLAMRYVDGTDLRELVEREGGLEPERAVRLVWQVASALDAAHRRGLVHRDVKPPERARGRGGRGPRLPDRLRADQARGRRRRDHPHRPVRRHARLRRARSRSAARTPTRAPTSTRSPACSTTRSPARCRSRARPSWPRCTRT